DAEKWGKPLQALLGALEAQLEFETAAIGGKDSMSGTFENISVPPTLISFACAAGELKNIISPELKRAGNNLYIFKHQPVAEGVPNYNQLKEAFTQIHKLIKLNKIVSAQTIKEGGLASALFKMAVGNGLGAEVEFATDAFNPQIGSLILETTVEIDGFERLGKVTNAGLKINEVTFDLHELSQAWEGTLESIFPSKTKHIANETNFVVNEDTNKNDSSKQPRTNNKQPLTPTVFIPIFPGTNCEYESEQVFEQAGAKVTTALFANQTEQQIESSIASFEKEINEAHIMMIPGGFSAGDEPDGSAKFIVSVLKNPRIKAAVHALLKRGGLMLGICNGFQALVKSGLLPYGEIRDLDESSATMTFNNIGRHISQTAKVRVISDKSPWLKGMKGEQFIIPFSHGEGRFYASDEMVANLAANGQIATQYIDDEGNIALNMPHNPNGSVHGIEGITDATGQIYGRMGHPERYREGLMKNIPEIAFMDIFKNGVEWFTGNTK
ncbi:MAG: hypothetical protein RLZZ337_298, partial [Bacteroidota bacterium]